MNACYDKVTIDKNVYELAIERMHRIYDLFDNVVVMFSGGKDSTAVLNIALEVAKQRGKLPLRVDFYDEEIIAPTTEAYCKRLFDHPDIDMRWLCVQITNRLGASHDSPYWTQWGENEKHLWVRDMPPWATTEKDLPYGFRPPQSIPAGMEYTFHPKDGTVCAVMGIRAQESMIRYRSVTRRKKDNFIIPYSRSVFNEDLSSDPKKGRTSGHITLGKPIYDWKTEDVWTAINKFGWDYNEVYDMFYKLGLAPHNQRVAPPFAEQSGRSDWEWQYLFPELWDKMTRRVDCANTSAMYWRTELFASGREKLEKPDNVSWKQFIASLIAKHSDPRIRKMIARRIDGMIRRHYKKSKGEPIPEYGAHPLTGLDWNLIASIALKGDIKMRKQEGFRIRDTKEFASEVRTWHRERRAKKNG